jgi:hypothetical protein
VCDREKLWRDSEEGTRRESEQEWDGRRREKVQEVTRGQ